MMVGLEIRCLAIYRSVARVFFSSSFYWFHFPIFIIIIISWSRAFIHSSFIWIKDLTRSSTYEAKYSIDFGLFFHDHWYCFFSFNPLHSLKQWRKKSREKEIPNYVFVFAKSHRVQEKCCDLNMWSNRFKSELDKRVNRRRKRRRRWKIITICKCWPL